MSPRSFGRYKIAEEVGRGAMGVVYRGVDPVIGRAVAIKAINVSYLDSVGVRTEEYLERFQREAQVAGRLSHPGIVKIYDLGPSYLVMEFIQGQSLAALLRARTRWPLSKILDMISEAADALDYAHAQGIVHRDVKPANLMLLPDGSIRVMDFGLARIEASTLTAAGEILGSASYMAPELVLGRSATPRSDVFSLAVVAYELLTDDRPFAGTSITAILHSIVSVAPQPTADVAFQLPPACDPVFARALAKEPGSRYPTASEFAAALCAARWTDRDPLLPDPKPRHPQAPKRVDPGATLPPVPKRPPPSFEEPRDSTQQAVTLRAMPPVGPPEDKMTDEKDEPEAENEIPATIIMKPGASSPTPAPPAPPPAPEAESDMPATVILKAPAAPPAAPAEAPPSSAATVIMSAPPSPSTAATGRMPAMPPPPPPGAATGRMPAVPPAASQAPPPPPPPAQSAADATVIGVPKTPSGDSTRPLPPPPVDTGKTGPVPVVPSPPSKGAAPRKGGGGLVIGLVAGLLLFVGAVVAGGIYVAKRYFASATSGMASTAPEAPPVTEETPAPQPPPPSAPPSTEAAATTEDAVTPEPSSEPGASPATDTATTAATPEKTPPPAPATVVITSDPPGAHILVGKKDRGVTPLRLTLPAGRVSISLEKDGFRPSHRDVKLTAGKQETVEARLEAIPREAPPTTQAAAPAPPAVKTGDLVPLGPDVTPPKKVKSDSVQLPSSAKIKKGQASVLVAFFVDEYGKVRDAKVVESAGEAIDKACLDTVKKWLYEPATLHGVRVRVEQKTRFTFQGR